jgi:hypothetical protein
LVAEVSSISARSTQVSGLKSSGSSTYQLLDQERSTKLTNLSRRVDSRVKVLQQASLPDRLIIDQDLESLIRVDNQSVQSSRLCDLWVRRLLEVFLLPFTSLWVSVPEDEMDFVGSSALVGTKHDCEWGLIVSWFVPKRSRELTLSVYSSPARRPSPSSDSVKSLM